VYSREIDGKILTLAPSGWTYKRTFVLYDKETGTLWYPKKDGQDRIKGYQMVQMGKRTPVYKADEIDYVILT